MPSRGVTRFPSQHCVFALYIFVDFFFFLVDYLDLIVIEPDLDLHWDCSKIEKEIRHDLDLVYISSLSHHTFYGRLCMTVSLCEKFHIFGKVMILSAGRIGSGRIRRRDLILI